MNASEVSHAVTGAVDVVRGGDEVIDPGDGCCDRRSAAKIARGSFLGPQRRRRCGNVGGLINVAAVRRVGERAYVAGEVSVERRAEMRNLASAESTRRNDACVNSTLVRPPPT